MKQVQVANSLAVENFLGSLDSDIKMEYHFRNALEDAFSYGWNQETLREIFSGIEEVYKNKGD